MNFIDTIANLLLEVDESLWWALGAASVVWFFASIAMVSWLLVRIPKDYFLPETDGKPLLLANRPVLRFTLKTLANVAGVLLVLAGIAMLVLPGQGVLTILVGLTMISFPGKRAMERRIVSIHSVHTAINRLRKRAGREPLRLPGEVR